MRHSAFILALFLLPSALCLSAFGQGTAFTYQGFVTDQGAPAQGVYDFEFRVFDAVTSGTQQGSVVTANDLGVTNGLFTVPLDPGAGVFTGGSRWLEIAVRPGVSAGAYTPLFPRQPITSAPYAVKALEAAGLPAGAVSGAMLADGAVSASKLAPGAVSQLGASDGSPVIAMQVNTNGLVGVGTNSPEAGLHIATGKTFLNPELLSIRKDESGSYTNLGFATSVAVSGPLAAVAGSSDGGVTLMDIANPANPILRSQIRDGDGAFTNLARASDVALKPGLLAVAAFNDHAVTLISVTNPASPVKLAELRDGIAGWNELSGAYSVAINGDLLAIAAYHDSAVTLADIANPAAPIKRAEMKDGVFGFTNLAGAAGVALSGNLLAIAALDDNAVTLVDVSDPANPVKRAELRDGVNGYSSLDLVVDVALSGNLLAIAAMGDSAVTLVDVSNPSTPIKLMEWVDGSNANALAAARSVAFSGNRLAATSSLDDAVTVFDVSNPASPEIAAVARQHAGGFTALDGAAGVAFAGANLLVAAEDSSAVTLLSLANRSAGLAVQERVGIGTTQPAGALHVVGDMVVEQAGRVELNTTRFESGYNTTASGQYSTAMGAYTIASGLNSTAMGGSTIASGWYSTAMGSGTSATNNDATSMGRLTLAGGSASTAMGYRARALHNGSFVWADQREADFDSTAGNQFSVRAGGGVRVETDGAGMTLDGQPVLRSAAPGQPFEILLGGERAFRLEPRPGASPNVIAGSALNSVAPTVEGATIAGGGSGRTLMHHRIDAPFSTIGGGEGNSVAGGARYATIAGGGANSVETGAYWAVIGGGVGNIVQSNAFTSVIGGGNFNLIQSNAQNSTIGGGQYNLILPGSTYATIPGGYYNRATNFAFAAGSRAKADHAGAFVWADSQPADFASTAPNQFSVRASDGVRFETGGAGLTVDGQPVLRGPVNSQPLVLSVNGQPTFRLEPTADTPNLIGGFSGNLVGAGYSGSTIGGGGSAGGINAILAGYAIIAGGGGNSIGINADYSAIAGGQDNRIAATSARATIAGGALNDILTNSAFSAIGGGVDNNIGANSPYASVTGGSGNNLGPNSSYSAIGGGRDNAVLANSAYGTIPGGQLNSATNHAFAAGRRAKALHTGSFVWADSQDADFASTTGNQFAIRASGGMLLDGRLGIGLSAPAYPLEIQSSQAVGRFTTTNNSNGAVLALRNNTASPTYLGAINFEDANGTPGQIAYLASDQMTFRVGGADRMNLQAGGLYVNGAIVLTSDRNAKADFASVDAQAVLEKVAALPLQSWSYTNRPGVKHVGPMAQDFRAAFGLGEDDKHIATVDADGVALAAIQGLNEKVEVRSQRAEVSIQELRAENAELKQRLDKLERLINRDNGGAR